MDVHGGFFNYLKNPYDPKNETRLFDLNECKQVCRQMESACVGINYSDTDDEVCFLYVRNGLSKKDAEALVPKLCSDGPGDFSQSISRDSSGEVVKANGVIGSTCWAHQSVGKFIIC